MLSNQCSDLVKENLSQMCADRNSYDKLFGAEYSEAIKELNEVGGRFLDVGCGQGYVAREIAKKFPNIEVHGIDMFLNDNLKNYIKNRKEKREMIYNRGPSAAIYSGIMCMQGREERLCERMGWKDRSEFSYEEIMKRPNFKEIILDHCHEVHIHENDPYKGFFDNVNLVHGDVQNLQFESNSFDLVTASNCFQYVPDKLKGISEIHRILKHCGKAFVQPVDILANGSEITPSQTKSKKVINRALAKQNDIILESQQWGTQVKISKTAEKMTFNNYRLVRVEDIPLTNGPTNICSIYEEIPVETD